MAAEVLETHVPVSIRAPVMGAIDVVQKGEVRPQVSIRAPVMGAMLTKY